MKHHQQAQEQRKLFRRLYSSLYKGCFDYTEEHLEFLRLRRDAYLQDLKEA